MAQHFDIGDRVRFRYTPEFEGVVIRLDDPRRVPFSVTVREANGQTHQTRRDQLRRIHGTVDRRWSHA